jgi:hypothetical protein
LSMYSFNVCFYLVFKKRKRKDEKGTFVDISYTFE